MAVRLARYLAAEFSPDSLPPSSAFEQGMPQAHYAGSDFPSQASSSPPTSLSGVSPSPSPPPSHVALSVYLLSVCLFVCHTALRDTLLLLRLWREAKTLRWPHVFAGSSSLESRSEFRVHAADPSFLGSLLALGISEHNSPPSGWQVGAFMHSLARGVGSHNPAPLQYFYGSCARPSSCRSPANRSLLGVQPPSFLSLPHAAAPSRYDKRR